MKTSKLSSTRQLHGIVLPTKSHPAVRQLKREGVAPSIHGNKPWKASALLIDYLNEHRPEYTQTVIDVGCGWGLAGIWCAKTLNSTVTSMDADADVFPYLDVAAQLNGVTTRALVSRFDELSCKQLATYDTLIAADICFWDELVSPVYNMIDRAVKAGVKHIIIADPERPTFVDMAQRCQEKHYADIISWQTRLEIKARGVLMIIENA